MGPCLGPRKASIARWAETRGLLRLPVRVERPTDVFNPSVLSVRLVPGRRIFSNAIPANGLSAPTADRSEDAECNAPPFWVLVARQPLDGKGQEEGSLTADLSPEEGSTLGWPCVTNGPLRW